MFHLPFQIPPSPEKITHSDSLISIGSCFAENIAGNLRNYKFNALSNPFGTIYNPISLSQLLMNEVDEAATVEQKGIYFHWQAHGDISALSLEALIQLVSERRTDLFERLYEVKPLGQIGTVVSSIG